MHKVHSFIPEKTKPFEVIDEFIQWHFLSPHPGSYKVGRGLDDVDADLLSTMAQLKSDDLANIRPELAMIGPDSPREAFSRDKLKFDREVLGIR